MNFKLNRISSIWDRINRNATNENWDKIEKVISDRGLGILSESAFFNWLIENGVKHQGEWDNANEYDSLSVVLHEGDSYTSKKLTPAGIDIKNDEYWVMTGNYNAQVEYYREDLNNKINEIFIDITEHLEPNTDITSQLQNIIDQYKNTTIRLRGNEKYYVSVRENEEYAIKVPSNTKIIMDETVKIELINTNMNRHQIFKILDVDNVYVEGGELIGDRYENTSTSGAWGFGIEIISSRNITIKNVVARDFFGDGFYIGRAPLDYHDRSISKNIVFENVISNNNRRQGLSIIAVENAYFKNCHFLNTNGNLPESGVDIETNSDNENVINVTFEKCVCKGNNGRGMVLDLRFNNIGRNIKFIDCDFSENNREAFRLTGRDGFELDGIVLKNCNMESNDEIVIDILGSNFNLKNVKIEDNKIKGKSILLHTINNLTYENNEVEADRTTITDLFKAYFRRNTYTSSGRSIDDQSQNNKHIYFENNIIIDPKEEVVLTSDSSEFYEISRNTIVNSLSDKRPFVIHSKYNIINENIFDNISSELIRLSSSSSYSNVIGNIGIGEILDGGSNNVIENNNVTIL